MKDPLCNSAIGSMVTFDYVTPDTGTASGVVKVRTIKRMPPGERLTGSLLNEAQGRELTPNALDDDGDRVGIRAPVLQPHAATPLLPLVPEFRQVRRAQLRKTDFEQFGFTDNCPGCANARAGRNKQWLILNNAVSALKESWRQPLKVTNDSSEPVTVSLRPPRSQGLTSSTPRDIPLWAKGCSLLRHEYRIPTRKGVAVTVVRYHHRHRQRHRQCHRHSNRHPTQMLNNRVSRRGAGSIQRCLKSVLKLKLKLN